jgi:nucleoside-diphosphate-sugar epimerase/SAM-dependent methyltransferase/quercetin dioxygenase-like cupin family protein
MEKIVITGGLGYIGTELCKIYSGEARFKNIVVIDSRFVSERVKQLTDWGITFIQCSIIQEDKIKTILENANLIYHLSGITDVAYTKTQSNEEKDREIRECGVTGTRNIINNAPIDCKIVFPSTHVVYEGFSDTKFNIDESVNTCPVLTYSCGKVQSEVDLAESKLDYVIVRLGSVYGYSTDTMRINIMPNLFSKIASQNGTISLFSGGVQYKSLVNLIDVVRAMKFLAESNYKREIFHLTNENMTIKEVADICKKHNSKVTIVETDDEIPNLGYTLSNKKLLSTGFKFLYNIDTSIKEMIENWSQKNQPEDLEYIVRGSKEYIDSRGKISNFELTEPINLIGYIESKAGSVRANHYHPIQEQKCLLITGKYISVTKDLSDENSPLETRLIQAGDLAVIKPNVAHTMVFLEDSIFLNLVRGEREHENYGITHTIPYTLVDDKFRQNLLKNYKYDCRGCGSTDLKDVISLGLSPLANNLLDTLDEPTEMYPLEIKYCPNCHNVQLSYTVEPSKMFDNYLYVSSTAASFRKHFEGAAQRYFKDFKLNNDSLVVDIGSNDGVFLKPMKELGVKVVGVEPAKNVAKIANDSGIETINSYFDEKTVIRIVGKYGKADVVTASNMFAHSDKLVDITNDVFKLLKEDGTFIVEVQYLLDTIKDVTFDNIYHEHVNYWSVTSINNFFKRLGFSVTKVDHIDTHGGSIRVYVERQNRRKDPSVDEFLQKEQEFGLTEYETYRDFAKKINSVKTTVLNNISLIKNQSLGIASYGSPAKATTLLNFFGINHEHIDYTIEDNQLKVGKFIPGVNIPIKNKEYSDINLPDLIIVLAWNFFSDIKKNNQELTNKGVEFISIKDLSNEKLDIKEILSRRQVVNTEL